MRAVVINGTRDVTVEKVDDPVLSGPDGAIVQVTASALCGSDLHFYEGDFAVSGLRPGHEVVGTVLETGSAVGRVRVGDRVLVSPVFGCGKCAGCAAGNGIDCTGGGLRVLGSGPDLPGGHAEAVEIPVADMALLPIPEDISVDNAVLLTDALPTGWTAASRADIRPGSTVLVIGLGPVGLYALQSAQVLGRAGCWRPTGYRSASRWPRHSAPSRSTRPRATSPSRSSPRPGASAPTPSSRPSATT